MKKYGCLKRCKPTQTWRRRRFWRRGTPDHSEAALSPHVRLSLSSAAFLVRVENLPQVHPEGHAVRPNCLNVYPFKVSPGTFGLFRLFFLPVQWFQMKVLGFLLACRLLFRCFPPVLTLDGVFLSLLPAEYCRADTSRNQMRKKNWIYISIKSSLTHGISRRFPPLVALTGD